jgi:uncharacterized membrane protein YqjE
MSVMPKPAAPSDSLRPLLFWTLMIVLATVLWKIEPTARELVLGVAIFLVASVVLFLWRKMKQRRQASNDSGPTYPMNRPIG